MNLADVFHASTRPSWMARLVVYIAVIVTLSAAVQIAGYFFW